MILSAEKKKKTLFGITKKFRQEFLITLIDLFHILAAAAEKAQV